MNKEELTKKIMAKVAELEESRLKKSLMMTIPAIGVFGVIVTFAIIAIVTYLSEDLLPVILIGVVTAIAVVLIKTDLLSYPSRFKQIRKYKRG